MSIVLDPRTYLLPVDTSHYDAMVDQIFEITSLLAIHPQDKRLTPQESVLLRQLYSKIKAHHDHMDQGGGCDDALSR